MATRPLHVSREFCGFLAPRYQSLVASYAEAKRERFLGELAQLEEEVHLARTHAQDKLERYALQHADRHGLQHAVGAGGCPCSRVVGTMLAGLVAGASRPWPPDALLPGAGGRQAGLGEALP